MASFFNTNRGQAPVSERQLLTSRYNASRANLLLILIMTAVNLILLVAQSNVYFLFSASIPYVLTDLGMFLCGMYPDELYEGLYYVEFYHPIVFVVLLFISIVILALYLICWIFSKKQRVGWMITALALFVADTILMFAYYGISVDLIIDIVFHAWVIVSLSLGIYSHFKLKRLPPEEAPAMGANNAPDKFNYYSGDNNTPQM